jgi:hypothetical protein
VLVTGWPTDLGLSQGEHLAAFPQIIAGTLGAVSERTFIAASDYTYNPDRDLVISYVDPEPIEAGGMSGGGVWLPPTPGAGLWDPGDIILIGIQVAQFRKGRAPGSLLATRMNE